MGVTVELLPLTTILARQNESIYQDVSDSIDTSRYSSAAIILRILKMANDGGAPSIDVEGSDDGQNYNAITALRCSAAGERTAHLSRCQPVQDPEHLWKYLRWHITPTGQNVEFCGRITVVLK